MKTHEFDGATICVRRKDSATVFRYIDIVEVVEDNKGSEGQKWLLLKGKDIAVVTKAMVLSENVDKWWKE